MSESFRCGQCHKQRSRTGSGLRLILGVHTRVCSDCVPQHKVKNSHYAQYVIGASGKRVRVPQGQQAKFMMTAVTPTTVGLASGVDERYQCTPEEAEELRKTGYYSSGAYRKDQQ